MAVSRAEQILTSMINGTPYDQYPQSRLEDLLLQLKEVIEEGGGGGTPTAAHVSYDNTTSGLEADDVQDAIDEVFQSVSDGKELIADAITDKGVPTSATDSFATMATNIAVIDGSPFIIDKVLSVNVNNESYTVKEDGLYLILCSCSFAGEATIGLPSGRTPIIDVYDYHEMYYASSYYRRAIVCKIVELEAGDSIALNAKNGYAASGTWDAWGKRVIKLSGFDATNLTLNAHPMTDDVQNAITYDTSQLSGNHLIIGLSCGKTAPINNTNPTENDIKAYSVNTTLAIVKGNVSNLPAVSLSGYGGGFVSFIDCTY